MNEATTTRNPSKRAKLPQGYPTAEKLIPKSIKSCYLTVLSPRLKAAETIIWKANHINYDSIFGAYRRPSSAKQAAWDDCVNWIRTIANEAEGRIQDWGIIGTNSQIFTAGAIIRVPKAEATIYVYITKVANWVVVKSEVKIFED